MLYCVLLIFDAGCDNRNQWPKRGHHRAPGRHYPNLKKFQSFQNVKNFQKCLIFFFKLPHPPKMHFCTKKVQNFLNLCLLIQNVRNHTYTRYKHTSIHTYTRYKYTEINTYTRYKHREIHTYTRYKQSQPLFNSLAEPDVALVLLCVSYYSTPAQL